MQTKRKIEAATDAMDADDETKNANRKTKTKKVHKPVELPDFWMDMDKSTFHWDKLETEELLRFSSHACPIASQTTTSLQSHSLHSRIALTNVTF